MTVTVYTDGGCDPNPGPGGWAAILCFPDREVVLTGGSPNTTNNRMEMQAAIATLDHLSARHGPCHIDLHTDSAYLCQGITRWIEGWIERGWSAKNGEPVKNRALWQTLYDLARGHQVRWHWVKGHNGDPLNERVDRLVQQARYELVRERPPASSPEALTGIPRAVISIGVSCWGSTGPGGWAAVLRSERACEMLCGRQAHTTSNLLLLQAAITALGELTGPHDVTVYTTSDYLGLGASQWVHGWRQRDWVTRKGEPVKNRGTWESLLEAAREHHVSWQVVRGDPLPPDLAQAKERATEGAALARSEEVGEGSGAH